MIEPPINPAFEETLKNLFSKGNILNPAQQAQQASPSGESLQQASNSTIDSGLQNSQTLSICKQVFPRLFKFQDKYERVLWKKIVEEKKPAAMLIAATGLGKTYLLGQFIENLFLAKWFDKFPPSLVKVLFVTKASVVTQTERVLQEFGLNAGSGKGCLGLDV